MKDIKRFYPSPRPGSARFQINGIGIRETMRPGIVHRPQGTGDFLSMCFHTEALAASEETTLWHGPETLIIWQPGEGQYYGNPQSEYLHSWIHCEGTAVAKFFLEAKTFRGIPLNAEGGRKLLVFLESLYEEIADHPKADAIICENLFENWVRDLTRGLHGSSRPIPERLLKVRRYMENNLEISMDLPQLAKMAMWSVPHFCEEFQRHFGNSPINCLIRWRMHQAAYLLQDINLSISEIGRRVGYDDLYHFSKLFKKHCGMSPRKLRESLRSTSTR